MAATAAESIGAVKVVHALSLEGTFAQAFTKQSRKNLATGAAATRLEAALERTVDLLDRKSTRLNSSHGYISYAVFCLKKKKTKEQHPRQAIVDVAVTMLS